MMDQKCFAKQVLEAEANAVLQIPIDASFDLAVKQITALSQKGNRGGALVVSGLGKSNFIGQKISATFASTGTASHFLHPTEAMHGDLGRIQRGDLVLLLSFSGNTEEIVTLAAILKQDGVPMIALTGQRESDLARLVTTTLWLGDITEACPHNLAPTTSSTAMLALGDALALAVSREMGFGVDDFRKYHPGGALGKQLMPITQAMRFEAGSLLPLISQDQTLGEALIQAETYLGQGIRGAGAMLVVDQQDKLVGIFTDGDLRRLVTKSAVSLMEQPLKKVMTCSPCVLTQGALVRDAIKIFREKRIDEIPVVDENGKPLGLIDIQDLIALKVIEG